MLKEEDKDQSYMYQRFIEASYWLKPTENWVGHTHVSHCPLVESDFHMHESWCTDPTWRPCYRVNVEKFAYYLLPVHENVV